MPLTSAEQKSALKTTSDRTSRKRRPSENNHHHSDRKRTKADSSETDSSCGGQKMGEATPKRANFSALSPPNNGFTNRASPLANNKPSSSKKLVIKNFKGEIYNVHMMLQRCLVNYPCNVC